MKRADRSFGRECRVQPVCLAEGVRVHRLHGVEAGTGLVVRLDAPQIQVDERPARQLLRPECGVNVVDGRFKEMKGRSGRLCLCLSSRKSADER